ncbi:TspO/MBR family protein [Haloarcula pelagica]|uniref:TspO/MBR family protein n=1 Tax=Haloarcula pelagica TaxID=3033389 RepID=UPI0024C3C489|nr:TspO/MBR family protein [Halomicroarcula sp. YJ-61-S]
MSDHDETGRRRPTLDRGDLPGAVVAVVLVNVVGALPAVLGGPNTAWFQSLAKPAIYPPPWVFGVVWPLLFTLMGVALYVVWRDARTTTRGVVALRLFVAQMAVNVAWTPTFFSAQDLTVALAVVAGLWLVLVPTLWTFWRIDRRAGGLLVPYFLWVSFAVLLNYRFVVLN